MNVLDLLFSGLSLFLDYVLFKRFRAVFLGLFALSAVCVLVFILLNATKGTPEEECYVDGYGEAVIVDGQIERYVIDDDCPYLQDS